MPQQSQRVKRADEISRLMVQLTSIDPTTLTRREELGNLLSFEKAVEPLSRLIDLFRLVASRDLRSLGWNDLERLAGAAITSLEFVKRVQQFDPNQGNPTSMRDQLVREIDEACDSVFEQVRAIISFQLAQTVDWSKHEVELKKVVTSTQSEKNKLVEELRGAKSSADAALKAIEEQAAKAGVSQNAIFFKNDADEHKNAANRWLIATVVTAVLALAWAGVSIGMAISYVPQSAIQAVQITVAKLITFSVLSFAVFWCGKNYRARKHNEMLNRHRQNALGTFQTFVSGTSDPRTREVILLQAANSAFALRSTGYEDKEPEGPSSPGPYVEFANKALPVVKASQPG